jgi:hypothetical protein
MALKTIPLGFRPFAEMIDGDHVYVDKTRFVYDLVRSPDRSFYLSRPRLFGRSTLLDTIDELFTGNRERFGGLWIGRSDYTFEPHPVISLELPTGASGPAALQKSLAEKLGRIAEANGLPAGDGSPGTRLAALVKALHDARRSTVAVLVDERDLAAGGHMDRPEAARANAWVLWDLVEALRRPRVAEMVHFTLVAGVAAWHPALVELRPGRLVDISLDPRFSGVCGFTLDELDRHFGGHMAAILPRLKERGRIEPAATVADLRARIGRWYGGYSFGGKSRLLNPWSVIGFFRSQSFGPHWAARGRSGNLMALRRLRPLDFRDDKLESYVGARLRKSDLNEFRALPVLFRNGYLTIGEIVAEDGGGPAGGPAAAEESYRLKLPNIEVASEYDAGLFRDGFGSLYP